MEAAVKQETIHLQSYGKAPAKPAGEFSIGDTMLWNFGYTSRVESIAKETDKTITYKTSWKDSRGNTEFGERKFLKTRLVAFVPNK